MNKIVLLTISARWSHTAFGARSLLANLGELRDQTALIEAVIDERAMDIAARVMEHQPQILGIGVYIWNTELVTQVVNLVTSLAPDLVIVLGGPEVIDLADLPLVAEKADHIIAGEAEVAWRELCAELLQGRTPPRLISAPLPDLDHLELPYDLYTDEDIAHRKIYVEASRGCPFGCEFCLSSRDEKVRRIPEDRFIAALQRLWERGARQFKFVDRAMHFAIGPAVLEFFLERLDERTFLHFEVVPDHLPRALIEILGRFPAGSLQLEAGVQSLNPAVGRRINRCHNLERLEQTFALLRDHTGAHLHADLIVGLPGETLSSFGAGFDRLLALRPHEIQVGLLKRLRGTKVARYERQCCVFNPNPPYEVLTTAEIDFPTMLRLQRFARYFDLCFNSGHFSESMQLFFDCASPFARFLEFSDWLLASTGEMHNFALNRLARLLASFMINEIKLSAEAVSLALAADYARAGKKPIPLQPEASKINREVLPSTVHPRQSRHRGGG